MTKVAVLDDWQGVARGAADWTPLQARAEVVFFSDAFSDEDDAAAKLQDFEIVLSMRERTPLPASLINRLPKLKMLGMTGARNLSLDTAACTARKIPVCNTQGGGYADSATAELALGLLISAARGLAVGDAKIRAGGFQMGVPVGIGLADKTIGLVGLGRLGGYMAAYCKALRMHVQAWSQNLTAERAEAVGAKLVSKDELMATSDAISIHMVLSPRSRGLVGAADIARMKPGAILINTSRGPIVDEAAMLSALHAGKIVAALDVYDREPLPVDHPLRSAPNTVLSPHLGYCVKETWDGFYPQMIENALAFLDGKPVRVTNPEVLG
ncbi:MAG TPA: D-2-hydroxyacid dehydrogenase family protein [Rhodopila sp.]|uniref:D-2-hydroxyacid dehydrogenase family protein n=1 Tax=Rhodopila sp. TaxID=2480087 RepID=UPI002C2F7460|nr:D-2-hydroxyacid dehydrogenase family protein [Rhodopila sp.]HVY16775.1 D-2-hydroxyacid dehydrogenase family protein [Rhodopila sp.]